MFQILNIASHNLFNFQDLNISEVLIPQTHTVLFRVWLSDHGPGCHVRGQLSRSQK